MLSLKIMSVGDFDRINPSAVLTEVEDEHYCLRVGRQNYGVPCQVMDIDSKLRTFRYQSHTGVVYYGAPFPIGGEVDQWLRAGSADFPVHLNLVTSGPFLHTIERALEDADALAFYVKYDPSKKDVLGALVAIKEHLSTLGEDSMSLVIFGDRMKLVRHRDTSIELMTLSSTLPAGQRAVLTTDAKVIIVVESDGATYRSEPFNHTSELGSKLNLSLTSN